MTPIVAAGGWHAALAGALLGLSLAAPPGPVTAIMATASLKGRVRESLLTAAGAISGDLTWLSLAILGAVTVLDRHPRVVGLMGLAGAALLLWMAWDTFKAARAGVHENPTPGSWRLGYLTVLTSPFSLAWWLANGTLLYTSWGPPGIAGMFLALVAFCLAFTYGFRWLGTRAASAAVGSPMAACWCWRVSGPTWAGRASNCCPDPPRRPRQGPRRCGSIPAFH